jgi:uridine kinase
VAEAAVSLSVAAAAAVGPGAPPYGVRVGVDGALTADTALLAEAIAGAVADTGRPVVRVSRDGFVRPRSVRLELGADDADAGWERWYDDGALRREVLDPLAAGGAMQLLPVLWDAERDRSARAARVPAAPGTVVVVDGPYLLRWELADAFDLVVHLAVSPAGLARRCPADDLARVAGSWARYLDQTNPAERASYVVRLEDSRHPALVTE